MKKNIILAIFGVVFMLGLVGCPVAETSTFEGVWAVTGGIAVEDGDYDYTITIDGDGHCLEAYSSSTGTPHAYTFTISKNTCNTIEMDNGLSFTYEKTDTTMNWTLKLDGGLLDAVAGPYYKMEKIY